MKRILPTLAHAIACCAFASILAACRNAEPSASDRTATATRAEFPHVDTSYLNALDWRFVGPPRGGRAPAVADRRRYRGLLLLPHADAFLLSVRHAAKSGAAIALHPIAPAAGLSTPVGRMWARQSSTPDRSADYSSGPFQRLATQRIGC